MLDKLGLICEKYVSKNEKMKWFVDMHSKYELHKFIVRFPIGMYALAFFAKILGTITGGSLYLLNASVVAFQFATFFLVLSFLRGTLSASLKYGLTENADIKPKMMLGAVAIIVGIIGSFVGQASAGVNISISLNSGDVNTGGAALYTLFTLIQFALMILLIRASNKFK